MLTLVKAATTAYHIPSQEIIVAALITSSFVDIFLRV